MGADAQLMPSAAHCTRWQHIAWSVVAMGTKAIKEELVAGCPEAARQLRLERRNTSLKLIQFFALIALKVMVMLFPRYFISGRIAWDFNGFEPAFLNQGLDVAIDRGFAEGWMTMLRSLQHFIWRERPVGFKEGIADRGLLPCLNLSFHGN
jgi:hypothetical protein